MKPGKPFERFARFVPTSRRSPLVRRFVVAEASMLPQFEPGDGLIAVRWRWVRRGQVRVFEHPEREGFWLVKRVGHVRGDRFEALSDNQAAGSVDSRRFGDVPIRNSYRVACRLPHRWLTQTS